MYVLTKTLRQDTTVLAASENKNILRQELVKSAKKLINSYLNMADESDRKKKKELFDSLNNIADATYWCDNDPLCPLSFNIERVPFLKVK